MGIDTEGAGRFAYVTRATVILAVLTLACGALDVSAARAQEVAPSAARATAGAGSADVVASARTPRQALTGFLAAGRTGDFRQAAAYMDLSALTAAKRESDGPRLARRLYLVLLQRVWIEPATVSDQPLGADEVGLPERLERLAAPKIRGTSVGIVLERAPEGERRHVWRFSGETVGAIDALYRVHGFGWVGDNLPLVFFTVSFAGLQLWQWTALALILVVGWVASRIIGHVVILVLLAFAKRTETPWDDAVVRSMDGPLGLVVWSLVLALTSPLVGLAPAAQQITKVSWKLLALVGLGWLLMRVWDAITHHLEEQSEEAGEAVVGYIPIVTRVGNVLVSVFILMGALDVIGVNVVGFVAGLGIGGLALAFAAQKSLEDLFGAVAIASDRPFKVGDFVTAGGVTGTIEDVGLRSTRIRALDRTLATIPNGALISGTITNFSVRDRFLFNPVIGVIYGTSVAQLTFIIDEIRKLLLTHAGVWQDAHRVRFKGFGASSLDIEVFCWLLADDYNACTAVVEELNFRIAGIVEASGSSFAFPSSTVYVANDAGMNQELARSATRQVEERRERGELAVPEPSEELRERLRPAPPGDRGSD